MAAMPSDQLKSRISMSTEDIVKANASLDKLILEGQEIPYDLRFLLIHLLATVQRQNMVIELMAMDLDHLTALHNIVMNHLKTA